MGNVAKDFNWTPSIGDPTLAGWITVALYLVTAYVCWRLSGRLRGSGAITGSEAFIWTAIAILFLALGINKQLDLQSALTEIARVLARAQGWYERRGKVQMAFVAAVVAVCLVAAIIVLFMIRRAPAITWLAALGTVMVLVFVLIRAASIHHIDLIIGSTVLGLRWNWILEIGGILTVMTAGWWRGKGLPHGFR